MAAGSSRAVHAHDPVRGLPSPAEDFIEGALELPRWLVPNPPATFIWRVRGWCMKGAGIHDEESGRGGSVAVAHLRRRRRSRGERRDEYQTVADDGQRLSLTFDNPDMDQEFALEDLEEGLLWACCCSRCAGHHVKARSGAVR